MDKSLQTSHSILITSSLEKVWDTLTQPEHIAKFLYGTKTETDWRIGSPITFSGSYEGHTYEDKGLVMANVHLKLLAYDYWSQFSGLEDSMENYSEVSYHLEAMEDGQVKFTWQQIGFKDKDSLQHTENGLPAILKIVKSISEENEGK